MQNNSNISDGNTYHRSFFLDEKLFEYILDHTSQPDEIQKSLIETTSRLGRVSAMQVAQDQGVFLSMLVAAIIGLISAFVFYKGLKGGVPEDAEENRESKPGTRELISVGLKSIVNPKIALAYAATFLARADVSINGLFISQWAITSGYAMGLSPSESIGKVVPVIVATNLISMFWD